MKIIARNNDGSIFAHLPYSYIKINPPRKYSDETKKDVATTLKAPREKWFKDENGSGANSLMADAFDSSIISWQVWETIRKLTCVICGKQYVRQLANVENADEIAEKLCQFVYDLKIDFKKQEDTKC